MTDGKDGKVDRLASLVGALAGLFEQEHRECEGLLASVRESVSILRGDTADRRLLGLVTQLDALRRRLDLLLKMVQQDFLRKIHEQVTGLAEALIEMRATSLIGALAEAPPAPFQAWCQRLLDTVAEALGADRGLVVFCLPDSTEANIVAARQFSNPNLCLDECRFSRTLLRAVLDSGEPLLVDDAVAQQTYAKEHSVRDLQLRSVLVVPLRGSGRVLGVIYVENRERPAAFRPADVAVMARVARFGAEHVHRAGLLPDALDHDRSVYLDASQASREIIGHAGATVELLELVRKAAGVDATVLIQGESGSGKELVARALHYQSPRHQGPFTAINCAAIPADLLESELFGHEKGSFTGAAERRIGYIEETEGGTLFLDEIGELAYGLQAKLLRFLQEGEYRRVGGREPLSAKVRVVAATSKDLRTMVQAGRFQEALFYRLNVIPIQVPPLRDRRDDIPLLVDHFLNRFNALYGRRVRAAPEVYDVLKTCRLQGNVRELENLVHRLVALADDEWVRLRDLPADVLGAQSHRVNLGEDPLERLLRHPLEDFAQLRQRKQDVAKILREQERAVARQAVREAGGNVSAAAAKLGVHRVTLQNLLGPRTPGSRR